MSEPVWHFQRLPNNIKRTITKVKVQQKLLWMIISGYKHEKKRNIKYLYKTKMGKRELSLEAVHRMWTALAILHFYLWTVFKVLVVRKKRHESNKSVEIVHALQFTTKYYRNTNDVSTHAWPWLLVYNIVSFFLSFKTMLSQNSRYTSFMPASENDHSNFRIYSLSLPIGTLAVIKRGSRAR